MAPRVKSVISTEAVGKFVTFPPTSGHRILKGYLRDSYFSGYTAYSTICILPDGTPKSIAFDKKEKVQLMPKSVVAREIKEMTPEQYLALPYPGGFTIGTDPEVFVLDENGVVIPAFKFLGKKPTSFTPASPYWDGFQAEFNTPAGYTCLAYTTDYVHHGLEALFKAARAFNPKAKLSAFPVVEIPQEMMEAAEEEHAQLGCAPSLNAYGHDPIHVPDPRTLNIRFAGCHLHFGLNELKVPKEDYPKIVKALDSVIGVMMTSMFDGLEDTRRRVFYGRAGEYRTPKHGLEWRVPSSAMLIHPVVFHFVYDLARVVLIAGRALDLGHVWKAKEEMVRDIINETDSKKARKLIEKNSKAMMGLIKAKYNPKYYPKLNHKAMYDMVVGGVRNHLDVGSVEKNWHLTTSPNTRWVGHSGVNNCCVANSVFNK